MERHAEAKTYKATLTMRLAMSSVLENIRLRGGGERTQQQSDKLGGTSVEPLSHLACRAHKCSWSFQPKRHELSCERRPMYIDSPCPIPVSLDAPSSKKCAKR